MKTKVKKFGVVGCGMISQVHARAIREIGAELVACYDQLAAAAERFSQEFGCKAYTDLNDFLADPEVQIVTICTPCGAHLEPAVAAAEAGKHVIVERPLEVTTERCDEIIEACEKSGVTLSTIFPHRFLDSNRKIKEAIESNRFGELTNGAAMVKWRRTHQYYDSSVWRDTWKVDDGDILMNQTIHCVDLFLWFMGDVTELNVLLGIDTDENIEVKDSVVVAVRFKNGVLGFLGMKDHSSSAPLMRLKIQGEDNASVVIDDDDIVEWEFANSAPEDAEILEAIENRPTDEDDALPDPTEIWNMSPAMQFKDVLDAIESGRKPLIDGYEGRKSVELFCAIYKSAKTHELVKLG